MEHTEGSKPKEVDNHLAPPDDNVSGLRASIHAPSNEPYAEPLRSAPGSLQTLSPLQQQSGPAPQQSFFTPPRNPPPPRNPVNLTHNRAHTVGRPAHPPFNHSTPRSARLGPRQPGFSTPPTSVQREHARTQSSPPTNGTQHRSPLNHRPVITGDAISRLARTIGSLGGGGGTAKTKV